MSNQEALKPLKGRAFGEAFAKAFAQNMGKTLLEHTRVTRADVEKKLNAELRERGYPEGSWSFKWNPPGRSVEIVFDPDKVAPALHYIHVEAEVKL